MTDLRLPLPPAIAGDPRFTALALLVQGELDRIRSEAVTLQIRVIDGVSDPGILTHLAWQFHVMGVEGWDFVPDTIEAKRDLIRNAIELHRYKGTRWAVETALSRVLKLNAITEEADGFRRADGHWAEYQINPGRVLARAEANALVRVAPAWAPARSRLVRVYHGYDRRAARYDLPPGGNAVMLDDWSGAVVDGVVLSFSSPFGVPAPGDNRPAPGWGTVPSFGAVRIVGSGLRYDDNACDGERDTALVRPGFVVVSAWPAPDRTGHLPAFGDRSSLAAGVKDGMAYDDAGAVWDVPAAWRMTGEAPRYDQAPDAAPVVWHLGLLAMLRAPASGDVLVPPASVQPLAMGTVVSVGAGAGQPSAQFDAPIDHRPLPAPGLVLSSGMILGQRPSGWGVGPWTDQPWGAAVAGFMMEVVE